MAESAAYARRHHLGGAKATTIPAGINAGATSATLADASTWAGGVANGNTRAMINRTGATPEEIEISAITGNDITISARGLQGTADVTHGPGVTIEIVSSPRDFNEANLAVSKTIGKVTAAGDLLVGDAANSLARLGIGTARQVPAVNSGATALEYVASLQSLLTAAGDIIQASAANTPARLALGTARQQLAVNAGATAVEYVASLQSLLTAAGDIVYASAANTPARLAKGTAAQVLKMNSGATAPEWGAVPAATFRGARAYLLTTAQTISTSTNTAINFNGESFDTNGLHSTVTNNSRVVLDTVGYWLVMGAAQFAANATGNRTASIWLNGAAHSLGPAFQAATAASVTTTAGSVAIVNATAITDYVELVVAQQSGGDLDVTAAETATWLAVSYLGA